MKENIQIEQIKNKIERLTLQLKYLEEVEKLKQKQDSQDSKETRS